MQKDTKCCCDKKYSTPMDSDFSLEIREWYKYKEGSQISTAVYIYTRHLIKQNLKCSETYCTSTSDVFLNILFFVRESLRSFVALSAADPLDHATQFHKRPPRSLLPPLVPHQNAGGGSIRRTNGARSRGRCLVERPKASHK